MVWVPLALLAITIMSTAVPTAFSPWISFDYDAYHVNSDGDIGLHYDVSRDSYVLSGII